MTRTILLLALIACAPKPNVTTTPPPPAPDPETCFTELVTALAADELAGRGVGTPGLEQAARLIELRMRAAGLEGAGIAHQQAFDATTGVALGQGNMLSWTDRTAEIGTDAIPLGMSSDGSFSGDLVFAGYGIRAEPLDYDDYAGLDVEGKIVLAMRFEPQEEDEDSVFDGRRPTSWSDVRRKALTARELGAAALVLVTPAREEGEPDLLPPLKADGPISRAGLPVFQVTRAVANAWLATTGTDLASERAAIDAELSPRSAEVGLTIEGNSHVIATTARVHNVLGVLPGKGPRANEIVVVGAHYDHLGMGGQGSMTPGVTAIHNGADDNASGVAAMLCAMADLAADPPDDRRTVLAIAFAAEEIGLGGSGYYVRNPVFPLEQTVGMLNLDMVGQLWTGPLQALGTDSAPQWPQVLTPAADATGITLRMGGDGYGPSDHMSFYEQGIPVVHYFTGAHDRYHTPADDAHTVDHAGGGRVSKLLSHTLRDAATWPGELTFTPSTQGPAMGGDSRGFGAYLGTVPDYSAMSASEGGVLLSGVRAAGPADLAGIRGADTIVDIGGTRIANLYDMTYALRDHKPGDTATIVVVRSGERIELLATFGQRGAQPSAGHGGTATHDWKPAAGVDVTDLLLPEESHLADLRQLTFGGENAEAYWSPDGRRLIFQRTGPEGGCDQQYELDLDTGNTTRLSSGRGRTTCGYYTWPEGGEILYATTEATDVACPPPPDHSQGYVWPLYSSFEIVTHGAGGDPRVLAPFPDAYDAEATVCMADGRIVFTSTRDGDLELYTMNADGSDVQRITHTPGYDGGAFFTPDCTALVWRASRPEGEQLREYQQLLDEGLVRPGQLELYRANPDGTGVVQLTDNGAANFGPYPMPGNAGIIFASNVGGSGREFDLWTVPWQGGEIERISYTKGFDGFPMFSPDGRWLVFASNRATAPGESDTNLFVARWVP